MIPTEIITIFWRCEWRPFAWGIGRQSKAHLYAVGPAMPSSACETAYCGDAGVNFKTKAKHCKYCQKIETAAVQMNLQSGAL